MARKNTARHALTTSLVLIAGCAQLPPEYSLERMQLEAQQERAKACYRQTSRSYPNVPAGDVLNACRRAYGLAGAGSPQPVGHSL